jgi:RNA polymerase sigma-70 factor (ECF subfamily)
MAIIKIGFITRTLRDMAELLQSITGPSCRLPINWIAPAVRRRYPAPAMSSDPESGLIRRCRAGEADAWDELFNRHYAATGRFIFQLAHDFSREDVEEITQEVFLSVIKNLSSFHGRSQFQTWVFRIAANKARDYRQRRSAAKRGGGQVPVPLHPVNDADGPVIDPPADAPAPDLTLMNTERMALLNQALEQLGEPCREIIELRYFGDLGHEEIGEVLVLNPKTVSSRLSKCLDRLEAVARVVFSRAKPAETPSN